MERTLADRCAMVIGSWGFIGGQAGVLAVWIIANTTGIVRFDPPPYILLNLCLSFQAAFTGPVLLMAANRQAELDRARAVENLDIDRTDHAKLFDLAEHIDKHFETLHDRLSDKD